MGEFRPFLSSPIVNSGESARSSSPFDEQLEASVRIEEFIDEIIDEGIDEGIDEDASSAIAENNGVGISVTLSSI